MVAKTQALIMFIIDEVIRLFIIAFITEGGLKIKSRFDKVERKRITEKKRIEREKTRNI